MEVDDEDGDGAGAMRKPDNPYEWSPKTLNLLPTTNERNYPQENEPYFVTKQYVPNKKFSLDAMLPEDFLNITLPSIMLAFKTYMFLIIGIAKF